MSAGSIGALVAAVAIGYLLGSIPVPYIAVRLATGQDRRTRFTGNVGVMNCGHVLGLKGGVAVFLAEVAKGMLAAWVGLRLGGQALAWLAIVAAVVGANWPVWLKWAGGRGNSTFIGGMQVAPQGLYLCALLALVWIVGRVVLGEAFRATRLNLRLMPLQFVLWSAWFFGTVGEVLYFGIVGLVLSLIFRSKHSRDTDDHMALRGKTADAEGR
jgi:glycerol-3-phosphate acyltransferase PlsY